MTKKAKALTRLTITWFAISVGLLSTSTNAAAPTEEEALLVAEELKIMISVGTGIVGGLQGIINAGNPDPAEVNQAHLVDEFLRKYEHVTESSFNVNADGLMGETRNAFLESYESVLSANNAVISKGGSDAFVPAFFRAEVFAEFNDRLEGRVKGYATNREDDLLNPDWGIAALMDYSLFAYYIEDLLAEQTTEPMLKRVAGRALGYYPMKLKQSCVSCHARQGLDQEVGAFGGALITEVLLEE